MILSAAIILNITLLVILMISVFKKPSIFIFALVTTFLVFLVRPVAVYSYGSTIITESFYDYDYYQQGLISASLFYLVFYLAALLIFHKKSNLSNLKRVKKISISNLSVILAATSCLFFIFLFLFIGGLDVLFINRSASVSTVSPSIRYIYPFAIVFLCVGSMQAVIILLQDNFFKGTLLLFFYLITSMIIAQRGFFILFVIIGTALILRTKRTSITSYFKSLLPITFYLFLAAYSKKILTFFVAEDIDVVLEENITTAEEILNSPDTDASEIWMLATKFINENGYLLGESLINNIFNILPHNQRRELGLMNGSDILNNEYTGEGYWELGFGFNVTLPIELYLNFGIFAIIIIFFIGMLLGNAARDFDNKVIRFGKDPSWEVLKFYAIYTLCSSLAGLQWSILFLLIYFITKLRFRIYNKGLVNNASLESN